MTSDTLARVPRVDNSPAAPCWQQIQIARQNSWFATRKAGGREVVYEAPCLIDQPPVVAPPKIERPIERQDKVAAG